MLTIDIKKKKLKPLFVRDNIHFGKTQNFCAALSEIVWSDVYTAHDAQQAFTQFQPVFLKRQEEHLPKRRMKFKYNNRQPW